MIYNGIQELGARYSFMIVFNKIINEDKKIGNICCVIYNRLLTILKKKKKEEILNVRLIQKEEIIF